MHQPRFALTSFALMRHNFIRIHRDRCPRKKQKRTPKVKALLEEGTLNPDPGKVRDPKFQENEFFDPRDIVQVKYEMLRRCLCRECLRNRCHRGIRRVEADLLSDQGQLRQGGIAGLVPRKRGPHGPHKLQGEALAFVEQQLVAGEPVRARELAKLIRQKFDLDDPPQDDRASGRRKKNSAMTSAKPTVRPSPSIAVTQYETLRTAALGAALPPEARAGLLLFLRRGMWGWARAVAAMSTFEQPSGSRPSNWKAPEEHQNRHSHLCSYGDPGRYQGATA